MPLARHRRPDWPTARWATRSGWGCRFRGRGWRAEGSGRRARQVAFDGLDRAFQGGGGSLRVDRRRPRDGRRGDAAYRMNGARAAPTSNGFPVHFGGARALAPPTDSSTCRRSRSGVVACSQRVLDVAAAATMVKFPTTAAVPGVEPGTARERRRDRSGASSAPLVHTSLAGRRRCWCQRTAALRQVAASPSTAGRGVRERWRRVGGQRAGARRLPGADMGRLSSREVALRLHARARQPTTWRPRLGLHRPEPV